MSGDITSSRCTQGIETPSDGVKTKGFEKNENFSGGEPMDVRTFKGQSGNSDDAVMGQDAFRQNNIDQLNAGHLGHAEVRKQHVGRVFAKVVQRINRISEINDLMSF